MNASLTSGAGIDSGPRERLRSVGARNLSLVELLALLVGSGRRGDSVWAVAVRLSEHVGGSVLRLSASDVATLEGVPGVGSAISGRIAAAFELGRRAAAEPTAKGAPIRGPGDVFRRMGPKLRDVPQEEFHALLLDARHRVVREVLVTRGLLDASLVHPRELFRAAVTEGASAVVLVHNHPSGDPTPSAEDREVTRQLGEAGRALGIPVLDHIVVGRGRYVSLAGDLQDTPARPRPIARDKHLTSI